MGGLLAELQTAGKATIGEALAQAFTGPVEQGKASLRSLVDDQVGGVKASLRSFVDAQMDDFLAKVETRATEAKGLAAKGVLAHYLASGLGIGSVLLILYGAWSLLSRSADPAIAALGLGLGLVALLVTAVVLATRRKPSARDDE